MEKYQHIILLFLYEYFVVIDRGKGRLILSFLNDGMASQ